MILCPNCSEIFEEKAGKLFCKTHGWHTLNAAGEVVPADEPTAEELSESIKSDPSPAGSDLPVIENPPAAEVVEPVPAQGGGLSFSDKSGLIIMVVTGLAAVCILGYAWYRNRKAADRQQGA